MKCCGETRTTPFCPSCGKELKADRPLYGLLQLCKSKAKALETLATKQRGYKDATDFWARLADSNDRNAAKWRLWRDQLEELLRTEQ